MVKKVTLIVLLVLAVLGYFFLDNYDPHSEKVFSQIETSPIAFGDDGRLHFFQDGFAVTCEGESLFFNYEGNPIEIPIDDDDVNLGDNSNTVTASTSSYIVIDDKYIYDTTTLPFEFVMESPQESAWDIKEFDDNLLIIAKSGETNIDPYILQRSNNLLHKVESLGELNYIDTDFAENSNSFSILTLDTSGPIPSSKILHFSDINVPYGVYSIEDNIFYRIFRYQDFFIVMGLHSIRCYDMIGDLKWERDIPNLFDYQSLIVNRDLALYFNNRYLEDENNTMIITDDGKYDFISIDRGIHHIKEYSSSYMGIQDKHYLVILNSRGRIAEKYTMNREISDIYWTPYAPNIIFLEADSEIFIYSITPEAERR